MSNATSIVGTWSGFVSWGDAGPPVSNASTLWTFKADGSWSYLSFPQQALFDKIGIRTMRIETDPFGNFLGQGYEVGCGRDWARLGNLYLQDGVWNGERILPPGYAKFVSTPAPAWVADKRPIYGAFFWVNGAGQHPVRETLITWQAPAARRIPCCSRRYWTFHCQRRARTLCRPRSCVAVN
jgi:CubicO group peptidase (beta-lactamase class C family)